MSEERKSVARLEVFSAGQDNYEICGYVRLGGIKLEIDTDMNKVRDFFTKRRDRSAHLPGRPRLLRDVED